MPFQSSLPHDWWQLQEGHNKIFGVGSISAVTAWSATTQICQEAKLHTRKIISSWPYRQLRPWRLIITAISQTSNVHGPMKEKDTHSYPQISRPEESQSPFLFTYAEQNTFFLRGTHQFLSTENLYPFTSLQKAKVTDSWESVTISVTLATRILYNSRVKFFHLLACVFLVSSFQTVSHY